MKRKHRKHIKSKNITNIVWIVIVISALGLLYYGGTHGWFSFSMNINPGGITPYPSTPITPYPDKVIELLTYTNSIMFSSTNICVGDAITGTITTNIPNGKCSIFYNTGTGYRVFSNVNLGPNGVYSASQRMMTAGTASFITVCCDAQSNCKLSNEITLVVRVCDTDGDGIPDETDPDDDNDGYSDEEEIAAGTDPKDPFSHPMDPGTGCDTRCKALGFATGRGPFASGSSCVIPEIVQYLSGSSGPICCCTNLAEPCSDTDGGATLNIKGTCTDTSGGSGTDVCIPADFNVGIKEWQCVAGKCTSAQTTCPAGYICIAGACKDTSQDSDGDGYSDVDEIEAGTDPNNANSHPGGGPNDEMCDQYCGTMGYDMFYFSYTQTENDCIIMGNDKCNMYFHSPMTSHILSTIGCCCWSCQH